MIGEKKRKCVRETGREARRRTIDVFVHTSTFSALFFYARPSLTVCIEMRQITNGNRMTQSSNTLKVNE